MKVVTAFSAISKQVCKHSNELKKLEYDINSGAATNVYIQLFDFPTPTDLAAGNVAPAVGAVPKKSWIVTTATNPSNNIKNFDRGELSFNYGVFVCVSTTQATLTIGTGNNKFDMVSAELFDEEISGTTEVQIGNNSTFQVWSEAAGAGVGSSLIRVSAVNLASSVQHLLLYAQDVPVGLPIYQWTLQATGDANGGDKVFLNFDGGDISVSGLAVLMQTAAHVLKTGCTFVAALSPSTPAATGPFNFYAEYK